MVTTVDYLVETARTVSVVTLQTVSVQMAVIPDIRVPSVTQVGVHIFRNTLSYAEELGIIYLALDIPFKTNKTMSYV